MSLTALPNELLLQISSYLHPRHHSALIQTNHRLHSSLSDALIESLCQPSSEITSNGSSKWASRALYSALTSQDVKAVQKLVSRGVANVVGKAMELRDMSGSTGRNRALLNDAIVTLESTDAARLLLQCGVSAHTKEFISGQTPLFRAVELGDGDMVRLFLNREDVDVNFQDHCSFTPLYMAVSQCKEEAARVLLGDPRVDVNRRYHHETRTVLHLAIRSHDIGIMRALLDRQDIDVNILAQLGGTPLHSAVSKGFQKGVEALLERPDVELNSLDFEGKTVLHTAAAAVLCTGEIFRLLLAQGERWLPSLNLREFVGGHTPLHLAAISGKLDIVHSLLADSRVNANILDTAGVTPLYCAIESNLGDVVAALLESGKVDVNASASAYTSPIYRAVVLGREVLLRMLLDRPGSDLAGVIAGTDIGDPSACESPLPDVSRDVLMEYLSKGNQE